MVRGAIILAGGQSRRMGQSKALLPLGSATMLERLLELVEPLVAQRVVVAAAGQPLPELPLTVGVARDARPDRGPLEGLFAGLQYAANRGDPCACFFVCGCDTPFIQPALVEKLLTSLGDAEDAVVPKIGDRLQPLVAVYHRRLLPIVNDLLARQESRMMSLFDHVRTRVIDGEDLRDVDDQLVSFRNLNTPADYQAALDDWNRQSR